MRFLSTFQLPTETVSVILSTVNTNQGIYPNEETITEYRKLASAAGAIESALQEMVVSVVKSAIPEEAKIAVLEWIKRADTFRGLSYMLHPQSEWMGGESFKTRAPHIAGR